MEALYRSENFLSPSRISELAVPADLGLFLEQRRVPPGARRRIQIGLHMRPAVALDFEDSAFQPLVDPALGGDIVLAGAEFVREHLPERRYDGPLGTVHEARAHIQHQ